MLALAVVLAFPLVLTAGFALAWTLSAETRGPAGLWLYLALLGVPLAAALTQRPPLPLAPVPLWTVAAAILGVGLWAVQRRRDAADGVSRWPIVPLLAIVVAEEVVWRAFLVPRIGIVWASLAFAAHHYVFGVRHVAFTFVAGLAWAGLFVASGSLVPPVASHLVYNAMVWREMRRAGLRGNRVETRPAT